MACFKSMKTKTCKRSECKFYHINGTKKEEASTGIMNGQTNAYKCKLTEIQDLEGVQKRCPP